MDKKYKYNSYCDKKLHTNNKMVWYRHVNSCSICQDNLSKEKNKEVEDYIKLMLEKHKETLKNKKEEKNVKVKGEADKKEVTKPVEVKEESIKKEVTKPTKLKQEVPKSTPSDSSLPGQIKTINERVSKIANLLTPIAKRLNKFDEKITALDESYLSLGKKIEGMSDKGKNSEKTQEGSQEGSTKVKDNLSESQKKEPSPGEEIGYHPEDIELPDGTKIPADEYQKQIDEAERKASRDREEKPKVSAEEGQKGEEKAKTPEVTGGGLGLPHLETPEQIAAMKQYLNQEEERLKGGGGEVPSGAPAGGKIPYIDQAKGLVNGIKDVVGMFKKGGDQPAGPTGDLKSVMELMGVLQNFNNQSMRNLVQNIKAIKEVSAVASKMPGEVKSADSDSEAQANNESVSEE